MVVWLFTGGKKYFFMEKYYLQEFLSFEREFWSTFFKKINFPSVHLLAHSALYPQQPRMQTGCHRFQVADWSACGVVVGTMHPNHRGRLGTLLGVRPQAMTG